MLFRSNIIINSKINEAIEKSTSKKILVDKVLGGTLKYLVFFFGLIMALNQVGIGTTILNIISGAILILVLIITFLGLKDFIPNFTAGIFIHMKGFLAQGDRIRMNDIEGVIQNLGLVETAIKTKQHDTIYIPNSKLIMYEVIKRKKK